MDCGVEGCSRVAAMKAEGVLVCEGHWHRHNKTGSFGTPEIRTIRKSRSKCVIEGCSNEDCGLHGLCKLHYSRSRRTGDPTKLKGREHLVGENSPLWTGDEVTYDALHQRLRRHRGKASLNKCIDCGSPAFEWSYSGCADPSSRRVDRDGEYSVSMQDYEPRCVPCHRRKDFGAPPTRSRGELSEIAASLYMGGYSLRGVSGELGASVHTVRALLSEAGVKIRGRGRRKNVES